MEKELKDCSIVELKSMAYDVIAQQEQNQKIIKDINNEIVRKLQAHKVEEGELADPEDCKKENCEEGKCEEKEGE